MNATPSSLRPAWGNVVLCALLALLDISLLAWHAREADWHWPDATRAAWAGVVVFAWLAFTAGIVRQRRRRARGPSLVQTSDEPANTMLVVYASQTGAAEQLARQTAESLRQAGMAVNIVSMGELDVATLQATPRVLFVVSTTGEGDAPDSAAAFVTHAMRAPASLHALRYGLLALGDRDYDDFCGFGRHVQHWLQQSGAEPLFDAVEVDNGDPAALRHWQHHLALVSGAAELPDWQRPEYQQWQLVERTWLNRGSVGGACFHLALKPRDGDATWRAGDLVEIGPRHASADVMQWLAERSLDGVVDVQHDGRRATLGEWLALSHLPSTREVRSPVEIVAALEPLPHREYSIASLPADGTLQLLVRRMQRDDGTPGIGSGWLTQHAAMGGDIDLRIRANPGFHAPSDGQPLILIGNGTGLAGLRALLKERIARGYTRNWLLFGERESAHDFHHRDEIERWHTTGQLERLDLAWSRDGVERAYVQDRLRACADVLQQWMMQGAAIYVCGSLAGMAPGVDAVLRDTLGHNEVERLREAGRYRRDVY